MSALNLFSISASPDLNWQEIPMEHVPGERIKAICPRTSSQMLRMAGRRAERSSSAFCTRATTVRAAPEFSDRNLKPNI